MGRTTLKSENLFDYFHGHVAEARRAAGVALTDDTELYLANMLVDRARTDRRAPDADTLAELHGRAAHAAPAEQARTYRELGDRALYAVGFFEESLEGRVVSARYYVDMGSAAYHRVDQVFKRWFADAFGPVFTELGERFEGCAQVVAIVRDAQRRDDPEGLVSLYERWARTGSADLAARLRALGVVVPNGSIDG